MRLDIAPPRGKYDRRKPGPVRNLEQRHRLIAATATAAQDLGALSVDKIVKTARVSRNTFYLHFGDSKDAVYATVELWCERLERSSRRKLAASRTPVQRWRSLADCWFEGVVRSGPYARLALATYRDDSVFSIAGGALAALIREAAELARLDGAAGAPSPERMAAVVGAAECLARYVCEHPATQRAAQEAMVQLLITSL